MRGLPHRDQPAPASRNSRNSDIGMATNADLLNLKVLNFLEMTIISECIRTFSPYLYSTDTTSDHAKAIYCRSIDIDRVWTVVVGINASGLNIGRIIAYRSLNGHDGFDTVGISLAKATPKAALEDLLATLRRDL